MSVQPVMDRWAPLRLRVAVAERDGRWRVPITGHRGNGMEVSRAELELGPAASTPRQAPALALGPVTGGGVPEAYVSGVQVRAVVPLAQEARS